jgi:hypothetical protein
MFCSDLTGFSDNMAIVFVAPCDLINPNNLTPTKIGLMFQKDTVSWSSVKMNALTINSANGK